MKLCIKEGLHGTSTAKIAKEAGSSNGTFFHYFKTKEILVSKLYLKTKEDFENHLLNQMEQQETSKSKLKQLWYSYANWVLDNDDCMTFFTMFSNSPYVDKLSKEESSRNFDFIVQIVIEGIENETLMNVHPNS